MFHLAFVERFVENLSIFSTLKTYRDKRINKFRQKKQLYLHN